MGNDIQQCCQAIHEMRDVAVHGCSLKLGWVIFVEILFTP